MKSYQILVVWSPVDRAFVAQVPDLPGCMAHGATKEKALENIRQAVDLYTDDLLRTGQGIPAPREYQLVSA